MTLAGYRLGHNWDFRPTRSHDRLAPGELARTRGEQVFEAQGELLPEDLTGVALDSRSVAIPPLSGMDGAWAAPRRYRVLAGLTGPRRGRVWPDQSIRTAWETAVDRASWTTGTSTTAATTSPRGS